MSELNCAGIVTVNLQSSRQRFAHCDVWRHEDRTKQSAQRWERRSAPAYVLALPCIGDQGRPAALEHDGDFAHRANGPRRPRGRRSREVDLYLTKPFSPKELLNAVEQALGIN
jgi:CheY-like chemotaxis protein